MPVFPTVPRTDVLKVQQKKGLHGSSLVIFFTEKSTKTAFNDGDEHSNSESPVLKVGK